MTHRCYFVDILHHIVAVVQRRTANSLANSECEKEHQMPKIAGRTGFPPGKLGHDLKKKYGNQVV